jgi:amino acid transporter
MSGLRQYLAIVIVLYGVLLYRHNYFLSFLFFLTAFFVHNSSIIFSIVFVLFILLIRFFSLKWLLIITVLFVALIKIFATDILLLLVGIDLYNSTYLDDTSLTNMKVVMLHLFLLFFSFVFLYFQRENLCIERWHRNDVRDIRLEKFGLFCIFLVPAIVILSTEVRLIERIALYFMPFQCAYIAYLYSNTIEKIIEEL